MSCLCQTPVGIVKAGKLPAAFCLKMTSPVAVCNDAVTDCRDYVGSYTRIVTFYTDYLKQVYCTCSVRF